MNVLPAVLNFTDSIPSKEGCYWMKCYENDDEPEWAIVSKRDDGVMVCILDSLGTYGLKSIHEGLTNTRWASAILITEQ